MESVNSHMFRQIHTDTFIPKCGRKMTGLVSWTCVFLVLIDSLKMAPRCRNI